MTYSAAMNGAALAAAPLCQCGSLKNFWECHGKANTGGLQEPRAVIEVAESSLVKLDLACGQRPKEGFRGVDYRATQASEKIDLLKFPWPWENESVDELYCSHFIEHIDLRNVEERDLRRSPLHHPAEYHRDRENFLGQDMLFAFFDECYRVLKMGCRMTVIAPHVQNVRAFQDPTHRQFIPLEMFLYLSTSFRRAQKLDHYFVKCNFGGDLNHTAAQEMSLLHEEAARRRFKESWNTIQDMDVVLLKKPLDEPTP